MAFYSNTLCPLCVALISKWKLYSNHPRSRILFTHLKPTLITYEQAIRSSIGPGSFYSQKNVLKMSVLNISDLILVFSSATGCSKWSDLKLDPGMSKGSFQGRCEFAYSSCKPGTSDWNFISQFMPWRYRILCISVGLILWHVLYEYLKLASEVRTFPCTADKCCSFIVVLLSSFAWKTSPCFSPTPLTPLVFVVFVFSDLRNLKILGLAYFLYLFLFSGLEYTLSFLTHQRFHFSRYCNRCCIFWLWYFPKSSFKVPSCIFKRSFLTVVKPLSKATLVFSGVWALWEEFMK